MTPEERRGRGTELCRVLAEHVADLAHSGIGHWPECWSIVADPDAEFMIALSAWEATGSEADRAKVRAAYDRVLSAWSEAVKVYEQQRQES